MTRRLVYNPTAIARFIRRWRAEFGNQPTTARVALQRAGVRRAVRLALGAADGRTLGNWLRYRRGRKFGRHSKAPAGVVRWMLR